MARPPIVPPSRRIHNWHALPVHGAGPPALTARRVEKVCNLLLAAFALAAAWLTASQGWNW